MRVVLLALVVAAGYFAFNAYNPAPDGNARVTWPIAGDSRPMVSIVGESPKNGVAPFISLVAFLGFVGGGLGLLGRIVPQGWTSALLVVAVAASITVFSLFFSSLTLVPIALDGAVLAVLLAQAWAQSWLRQQG